VSGFPVDKEARLLELLGQELDLVKQMRGLTERQTELLAEEDIDAFEKSLDVRQALIEKIDGLHQESDILMQSYMSSLSAQGRKKSGAIETTSGQIRETIAKCAEIDEKNASAAKEKAEEYLKQVGKLSMERKSIGAYVQQVTTTSEMFDKMT
jgi:hypothetical protein